MKYIFYLIVLSGLFLPFAYSHAATGGIDATYHFSKVCHDALCTTPTPGVLNWKPTGTTVTVDSVTGLSGKIWGNELGWVNLNPTGQGVLFADPSTGILTGKAWSQVSGWINFAPTGQQVRIDPATGEFSGWAWTGGPEGGWIKFDCASVDTCIKTSWRGAIFPTSGGGGGGHGPDVCTNFPGWQGVIPEGDTIDADGNCVPIVDYCPNLAGIQTQIPVGFVRNIYGSCIPNTIDYCPNMEGMQTTIPVGYVVSGSKGCVKVSSDACPDTSGIQSSASDCLKKDSCSNIAGIQGTIPNGYVASDGSCFPSELDLCNNIAGNQTSLPDRTILSNDGTCTPEPEDLCPNLGGYQMTIPQNFHLENGICLFDSEPQSNSGEYIVHFPFVPSSLQIPSDDVLLKALVKRLGINPGEPFKVDVTSVALSIAGLVILIYVFVRICKVLFRKV